MHNDDKEIGKKYRRQKRKVAEGGDEQARKVFDVVNMSMLEVSRTEVHTKLIFEFQKEDATALDTPRDVGEYSMVQKFSSNSKND